MSLRGSSSEHFENKTDHERKDLLGIARAKNSGGPAWENGHFEQRGLFVVRFFNATKHGKARGTGCLSCLWCTFLMTRKVFAPVFGIYPSLLAALLRGRPLRICRLLCCSQLCFCHLLWEINLCCTSCLPRQISTCTCVEVPLLRTPVRCYMFDGTCTVCMCRDLPAHVDLGHFVGCSQKKNKKRLGGARRRDKDRDLCLH